DLHVEQPQETAPEPEPERHAALRLVREAGVVEMELLEGVTKERVVLATERIEPGEDERLRLLVAGQRLLRGLGGDRDGVTDLRFADILQAGRDIAHLAGDELLHRDELR